ncbi:site-2 protease family protein [Candidatus Saccharibacteria bacterium]|nr:site-2 protease family protein [Candidatus Saccharibacteria bacterium]
MSIALLIFGILSFVGLVIVHEWGHFIAARRSGVEVEEFGIGFPPKAATITKKNGTEYTLNWLPLGGFVRLKGEHDGDKEKGSFGAAPINSKVRIMIAGVAMNLLTAFLLLTLVAIIGMPQLVDNQFKIASDSKISDQRMYVSYVDEGSPADKAGIQVRDQLLSITDNKNNTIELGGVGNLSDITKSLSGQEVSIKYIHASEVRSSSVMLLETSVVEASRKTDTPKGYLGIVPTDFIVRKSTWSAPIVALGTMGQFTQLTMKGLGSALAGLFSGNTAKATEQVSGPVGVFFILKEGSTLGMAFILMIIAVISLTLAIMNILPIPALDGGRLFVTLLFRGLCKPLTPKMEDRIHGTGMAVLLTLFVLITIVDVKRFF